MKYIWILILAVILYGCQTPVEKAARAKMKIFDVHKALFIQAANVMNAYPNRPLPKDLQDGFEKINVDAIQVRDLQDKNCPQRSRVTFHLKDTAAVQTFADISIVYFPCQKFTSRGVHGYDGRQEDAWGLGDDFVMYTISKK